MKHIYQLLNNKKQITDVYLAILKVLESSISSHELPVECRTDPKTRVWGSATVKTYTSLTRAVFVSTYRSEFIALLAQLAEVAGSSSAALCTKRYDEGSQEGFSRVQLP